MHEQLSWLALSSAEVGGSPFRFLPPTAPLFIPQLKNYDMISQKKNLYFLPNQVVLRLLQVPYWLALDDPSHLIRRQRLVFHQRTRELHGIVRAQSTSQRTLFTHPMQFLLPLLQ